MTPFILLTEPNLERSHARMLKSVLTSASLVHHVVAQAHTWDEVEQAADVYGTRVVLSVGKHALDEWHQWGLVQVGQQHGSVFSHLGARGQRFMVMVIEHPGTLMQQSFGGKGAREAMRQDLREWGLFLEHDCHHAYRRVMYLCGRCQNTRVKGGGGRTRPAEHWVEELDGVGLCGEHWRTRGSIKSKWKKKRVDKSKREAQVPGQLEMLAGDGARVKVTKG